MFSVEEESNRVKDNDIVAILIGHKPHNANMTEACEAVDIEDINPYYTYLIPYLTVNSRVNIIKKRFGFIIQFLFLNN